MYTYLNRPKSAPAPAPAKEDSGDGIGVDPQLQRLQLRPRNRRPGGKCRGDIRRDRSTLRFTSTGAVRFAPIALKNPDIGPPRESRFRPRRVISTN